VISLTSDDCARDAERLTAKGVVFVKEPGRMEYGGMTRCRRHLRQTGSTSTRSGQIGATSLQSVARVRKEA
jgi:hypothetical protein